MLQGRLFAYADTQRYRIGPNYMELPVNRPLVPVDNNNIDGAMRSSPQQGDINYEPTNDPSKPVEQPEYKYSEYPVSGVTQQRPIDKTDNFRQAGEFYRSLSPIERDHLIKNLAADLGQPTVSQQIRQAMVSHFYQADPEYGTRLAKLIQVDIATVKQQLGQ
jgi:catalase